MKSFTEFLEELARRSPLMDSGEQDEVNSIVRIGKDLHKENQTPFWDEFITLCNNADALASLLKVSREKIMEWPARIKETLEKIEKHTSNNSERPEIKPTGQSISNQDPIF